MLKADLIKFAQEHGLADVNDDLSVEKIKEALAEAGIELPKDPPKPTEPAKPVIITFASKFNSHRVGIRPGYREVINGIPVKRPGKSAVFENGVLNTDDTEVIEYLRNHPRFGRDASGGADFWEIKTPMAANALRR